MVTHKRQRPVPTSRDRFKMIVTMPSVSTARGIAALIATFRLARSCVQIVLTFISRHLAFMSATSSKFSPSLGIIFRSESLRSAETRSSLTSLQITRKNEMISLTSIHQDPRSITEECLALGLKAEDSMRSAQPRPGPSSWVERMKSTRLLIRLQLPSVQPLLV